ncbi:MAG: polyprenyl synthetase family protein [Candidatus Lambdaproteobacteria bacterium]|nr:polyprenyl synthetase family protein [Candidatus Lambdaproteobacteria bacterium]
MDINKLIESVKDDLGQVEREIFGQLHTEIPLLNELGQYIVSSGGKRLRPVVLIVGAKMFGPLGEGIYKAASAVEYLHTATLLHDDVVDDGDLRRARKAPRAIWGNAASVLVGDYLLAVSFRTLTLRGNLTVLDVISHATSLMAKGEILQLIRTFDTATEQQYLDIIVHKTACLFAAAAQIGAAINGATPAQQQALYEYGNRLGIAFQIVDDALDYVAERDKIGKPLGADFKERKVTLPLSRLLHVARNGEREELLALLRKDAIEDRDVLRVIDLMRGHDVLPYTLAEARRYAEQAKLGLAALPDCREREMLAGLADYAVAREL